MSEKQIGIMVGVTLVILIIVLTTYNPSETTKIRVEMQDLIFKNVSINGVTSYITLNPAASMADTENSTHYFFIMIQNQNLLAVSGDSPTSQDIQITKPILQKVSLYEVVDFMNVSVEHQEIQPDGNVLYWYENYTDVLMKPASDFSIPAMGTKWYSIALDAPTFQEADFNVTITLNGQAFDLDPTITTCGTTLTSPGVYILVADEFCTGDGVTIASDDIEIDLQGYKFDGDRGINDYGIQTNGSTFDNLTIVNGRVTQFGRGINIETGSNIVIQNMTSDDNFGVSPNGRGIRVVGTSSGNLSNVTISRVDVYNNDDIGVIIGVDSGSPVIENILIELSTVYENNGLGQVWGGTGNGTMHNNTFYDSGGSTPCVYISGTGQWNLTNNTCYGASGNGIYIYQTDDEYVANNTIYNTRYGIGIQEGDDITVSGNVIYNGTGSNPEGIYVNADASTPQRINVDNNTIYDLTYGIRSNTTSTSIEDENNFTDNIIYNVTRCIYLTGAAGNLIQDLDCDNATVGIYLESSSENNTIDLNDVYNASGSCIYINGSSGSNVTNNEVATCGVDGIRILSSSGNALVQNNTVNVSTNSCINSDSHVITVVNNTCFGGGSDGITLNNSGENHTITGNTMSDFTDDCYNLGPIRGTLTIADNTAYNCTDAGFLLASGFPNATTFNNSWAYDIDRCVVSGVGNTTVWNGLACGYNETHGISNWTQVTFNGTDMDDGTNVYFNPEWISINSTENPGLDSNATLTFLSADNCSEVYLWNASGFPTTKGNIIALGTLLGIQNCTDDTVVYNATTFSGYALWNSENTYTIAYTSPNNTLNFTCFQPYMNSSQPDYQDVQTPSIKLNNSLNATIYNITVALNDSLLTGVNLYTWTSGFRPPFTTQNWSKYGLGVVNIPLNLTNATTTIVPKVKAFDIFNFWYWVDCVNVSDNQSQTYNLTWGGGAGS